MNEYRLTLIEPQFDALRDHLLQSELEQVAILYGHDWKQGDTCNLLISSWEPIPTSAMLRQRSDVFSVDSNFLVPCIKQARSRGDSVLLAHSHPGDPNQPRFSVADDRGEKNLYSLLAQRIPDRTHGAVVVSPGGVRARFLLPSRRLVVADEVRIVGRRIYRFLNAPGSREGSVEEEHVRQALIWGSHGQTQLRDAHLAVVGAGGTGSVVAQQLIHLGVGTLTVVDPQLVERSNLSRIVGAKQADVGVTPKVLVIHRTAAEVDPHVAVHPVLGDVVDSTVLEQLKRADLIFCCTDSHLSRAVLNAFASQYSIPMIDLGFAIDVNADTHKLVSAIGEIRMVVPGGYCLSCAGFLDADRILAERTSPEELAAHPGYFANLDIDDPSVITVNSVVASLAVTLGCDMLVPTMRPVDARDSYWYNARKGLVSHRYKDLNPNCAVCGLEGRLALGESLPLPG